MINDDQEEFWNVSAGPAWVALYSQMDALMLPVLDLLLETAALRAGDRVLDIGCGTGASVLEAVNLVGATGHVTGCDIAETMLEFAAQRLRKHPNITLLRADAQVHPFAKNSVSAVISRFGMMFFDDSVAALENIAGALTDGGAITFVAWGPAPENPWFMEPAHAANELLGPLPKVDRTLPGPFAFEETDRVTAMMAEAGLVDITARTANIDLTPEGNLMATADLCCHIGPADKALQYHEATEAERAALCTAIVTRFAKYDGPTGLHIPASINVFQARKSA
jgi:SAM-dependent methyltransferase